jgi:hypothetical protein
MYKTELDARRLEEQLKKLPADVQERIGYMIQGALLVSGDLVERQPNAAPAQ